LAKWSAEYGPIDCAEESGIVGFAAATILVAELMEALGMVHLGEVGQFVIDYVVAQFDG
jgi:hypothetical protein